MDSTPEPEQQTMRRKPILMPPSMIERVDRIAKSKNISFAAVVRDAVNAFDDGETTEDEVLLDALADAMIQTTRGLVAKIDELEKKLDETHAMLETV